MNIPPSAHARLSRLGLRSAAFGGLLLSAITSHAASDTWLNPAAGGNWSDLANWTSGTGFADGVNATATFGTTTGNRTVNLDTNVTLGTLNLAGSGGVGWTVSGANTLTMSTGTSNAPVIAVTSSSGSHTISAALAGTQGFSKNGNGKLTLSGTSTYTGVTTLTDGNLTISSGSALGSTGTGNGTLIDFTSGKFPQLHFNNSVSTAEDITLQVRVSSGTAGATQGSNMLFIDSGNTTLSGALTLNRATTGGTNNINLFGVQLSAGTLTLSGPISGTATGVQASGSFTNPNQLQFRIRDAVANLNVTGVISDGTIGTGGLTVQTATDGMGMLRLSGANTYSGNTVHLTGAMLINNTTGSGTGTGSVSVASGATFGGTGIIKPTGANGVTFASGSIVSPGDLNTNGSAIVAGKSLTFDLGSTTGSVVFDSGATISINLNAAAATPAEVSESLVFIGLTPSTSQVTFNNNVVNFSVTGGLLADGVYTLASFSADNAYDGQWVLGTGLESLSNVQLIQTANSIQLMVGAIPEPASAAALAGLLGIGAVVIGKRRRSA
jgi:autotransporter-associated beta strand protein